MIPSTNNNPNDSANFHYDDNDYQVKKNKAFDSYVNSKIPKHNKMRLIYRIDHNGVIRSYRHITYKVAKRITMIISHLQTKKDMIQADKLYEELKDKIKVGQNTFYYTLHILCGVVAIDIKDETGYRKIMNSPIDVNQGLYHKKRNLPKFPQFYEAPLKIGISRS